MAKAKKDPFKSNMRAGEAVRRLKQLANLANHQPRWFRMRIARAAVNGKSFQDVLADVQGEIQWTIAHRL